MVRERRNIALIGKGLGISQGSAYHYLHEGIDVLAARAPGLREALAHGHDESGPASCSTARSTIPTGYGSRP